ncbi:hypothetical protein KDW20_01235 [Burkholderia cenocepacia]|uniref:anti-phage dCTP deaminase n=1 Tax=Burkholderia cenocepacia TaxID=95486 RepID=UPI001B9A8819|nr:anti-phage dCTP deaminase [Burkholderia cenocepacia]MBR8374379.1 hypothetical protein [Burkholderia cenocepacia]
MNKKSKSAGRKSKDLGAVDSDLALPASTVPAEGIELVFGLVGPTGVDLTMVCDALRAQLTNVGYEPFVVNLSKLIPRIAKPNAFEPANEYDRIKSLMKMGTKLRENTGQADIVARLGIAEIRALREARNNNPLKPIPRAAYIVRSLKRPEEVELYRTIYGKAFTLISVYSPRDARLKHMRRKFSQIAGVRRTADELAAELINRDYAEEGSKKYGQGVSETFPLADYFLTTDSKMVVEENVRRLIYLIFGDPYISPTRDEQGMFFAQASALRSLDLSRQVGAAIISGDGDLLSTGCNEVPKHGGGLYWGEDSNRKRDVEIGHDTNVAIKREIVEDAFAHLREAGWLSDEAKRKNNSLLADESLFVGKAFLRGSKLFDVIEFGRAVHAEMAAITQAARNGISLSGNRLFCTTFPCHICARHIVSSGLSEVVFIEPYEKSRTKDLYDDSIAVEPSEPSSTKSNFRAFVGVAPRRYMAWFKMASDRKDKMGSTLNLSNYAKTPRVKRYVLTYLALEDIIIKETIMPAK